MAILVTGAVLVLALAASGDGGASGAAAAPAAPPPAAAMTLAQKLARLDQLNAHRDNPKNVAEAQKLADAVVAEAPNDYGALWRAARVYVTLSDQIGRSNDDKSKLGKQAWDLAARAVAANPNDVEGHYWAALGIGNYALGLGVVTALAKGIEGKFTGELSRATFLDEKHDHGGIEVVWGAYYLELPWPKRDRAKSEQHLRRALEINPANLRARLYLARVFAETDRKPEAKAMLAEIAAAQPGRYDYPEEHRVKIDAVALAKKLKLD